jgi:hypothetical protein
MLSVCKHNRAQLQEIRVEYEVRLFLILTLTNKSWALSRDQRVFNDYRGPGSLAVVQPPSPLCRQPVVSLSQSSYVSPVELADGRKGGRGGRGAKSCDRPL